jgi:transcriptional regulator with XRE-family HTH domain
MATADNQVMDRDELADFLRRRRAALQPTDVGMQPGPRRRTRGLRREEVAALCSMSTDYYTRLEQRRGPQPSVQMLGAIARGMRLTLDERDHLFRLAGHVPPPRTTRSGHVNPGMMRIIQRLDCPAEIISDLGETLVQNPMAVALLGDRTRFNGMDRFMPYRWFTDPAQRRIYPEADHAHHSRAMVADLRSVLAQRPDDSEAVELVEALRERSEEFAALWDEHKVAVRRGDRKRIVQLELGIIELDCQVLTAEEQGQRLLVFTATPGTEDADRLELLKVIGDQRFGSRADASPVGY